MKTGLKKKLKRILFGKARASKEIAAEPGATIHSRCTVLGKVSIGFKSYVNPGTILRNVAIGRFCSIGRNCSIGAGRHPTNWLSTHPATYQGQDFDVPNDTVIGNDVWIGDSAVVMSGVTIGDGLKRIGPDPRANGCMIST
jgi:acetyltransferase-like isoleucine patch superfamily enzyme